MARHWMSGLAHLSHRRHHGLRAAYFVVGQADRIINPQTVVDHWDRMGLFYAPLERGHTTASEALQRLVSGAVKNHFYRTNRDLGGVFRTGVLLGYLSELKLRARGQAEFPYFGEPCTSGEKK